MSEELKDASIQLPRAMMWATVLNGVLGITMLITPIWILQSLNTMQSKLVVITIFIFVFLLVLSLAMVAKPFEALGTTAA